MTGAQVVDVWWIPLPEHQPPASLLFTLGADELARAARIRIPAKRTEYLSSHVAMRHILAQYIDAPPADLRFSREADGKPRLVCPGGEPPACFNLSQTTGLAIVAVSRDGDVGADVERHRELRDVDEMARRYFSAGEQADWSSVAICDRSAALLRWWTQKEAYLKACGDGVSRRVAAFDVAVRLDDPVHIAAVVDRPGDVAIWQLYEVESERSHTVIVAATPGSAVRSRCFSWPG